MTDHRPEAGDPDNDDRVRRAFAARAEYNDGLPILLHVEPSGICNLPCPGCPQGTGRIGRSGYLDCEVFHQLFVMLAPTLRQIVFSGWGEPLLNPHTPGMIAHAVAAGIPATLNTNGVLVGDCAGALLAAGLTTINISLDGAVSKATHRYTARQTFRAVVKGVRTLLETRARLKGAHTEIHGQFLVDEETVEEIGKLRQWAFTLGVDHIKFKRRHDLMPGQVDRSRQRPAHELRQIERHDLVQSTENLAFSARICAHPWESVFLACNGTLSICSWDPYQRINLGPVPERFEEVWNGEQVQALRRSHAGAAAVGEPCRTCNRLPGYLRFEDAAVQPAGATVESANLSERDGDDGDLCRQPA